MTGRTGARRLAAVAVAAAAVLAVAPAPGPGALADGGRAPRQRPDVAPLRVLDQDVTVAAEGVFAITVGLPADLDATTLGTDGRPAAVVVTSHRRATTRDEVADALAGDATEVEDRVELSLAPDAVVPVGRPGPDRLSVSLATEIVDRVAVALQLADQGVHPVTVELVVDDETVASVTTFVSRGPAASDPVAGDLSVGLLLGEVGPVEIGPDGGVAAGGRARAALDELAAALEAIEAAAADTGRDLADVPRGVALRPPTLAAIAASDPAFAQRMAELLDGAEVLSSPRLPLDAGAAVAAGQAELYTRWLREGEDELAAALPTSRVDRALHVAGDAADAAGLALARDLGTRLLVVPEALYLQTPENIGGYTVPTQFVGVNLPDGTSMPATIIDRRFAEHLASTPDDPLREAVAIAAELLVLRDQVRAMGLSVNRHGLLLARDDAGAPDPQLLQQLVGVLLSTEGLRVVEPSDLAATVQTFVFDGREFDVTLPEVAPVDLSGRFETVATVGGEYLATVSMLPPDAPERSAWGRVLDALPSTALTDGQVEQMVAELRASFAVYLRGVLGPEPFSFTLTGDSRPISFELTNTTDTPLRVRVRMTSVKLDFPDSDRIIELPPGARTAVQMRAELVTNGTSSVFLDVLTPATDTVVVPRVTLTGSAYALTGLGQLLTGAGLLVVCTWWLRNWRRARRRRQADAVVPRHPARSASPAVDAETGAGVEAGAARTGTLPPS